LIIKFNILNSFDKHFLENLVIKSFYKEKGNQDKDSRVTCNADFSVYEIEKLFWMGFIGGPSSNCLANFVIKSCYKPCYKEKGKQDRDSGVTCNADFVYTRLTNFFG